MDSIKKLLVLVAGVALVLLAATIVHQTREPAKKESFKPQTEPFFEEHPPVAESPVERETPSFGPESEKTETPQAVERKEEPADTLPVAEDSTIAGLIENPKSSLTKERTPFKPSESTRLQPAEPPVVSGALPGSGNPNTIFVSAARKILPAVVSIRSVRQVNGRQFNLFHRWFGPDGEENGGDENGNNLLPGAGSGILVSEDGYILTNHHVVEEADEVRITLHDKREFTARIVGSDPTTDVAALKINGEDLPFAELGNSDNIQVGEWVMAVGNPLEFRSTVTAGIISALRRDIRILQERFSIENFIQTDAVINPGNSGGALVNLEGKVIGVNTAIATRNGYYQGYGFAIPINLAKKVLGDLIEYGRVRRALLGISIAEVSDQVARSVGLDLPQGALIQSVQDGYPAAAAGLKSGDIVLKVNGRKINSVNDLQTRVAEQKPGSNVLLEVWRDQKAMQVRVRLAEAPTNGERPDAEDEPQRISFKNLGMILDELTDDQKEIYDVEAGVYIKNIVPESPANRAGMTPRAVIRFIDGQSVESVIEVEQLIDQAKSSEILKVNVVQFSLDNERMERILFLEVP